MYLSSRFASFCVSLCSATIRSVALLVSILFAASAGASSTTLGWVPNAGQWHESVAFQIRAAPVTAYVTRAGEMVHRISPESEGQRSWVLAEKLVGADVTLAPAGQTPTRVSYFTGADPKRWRSGLPSYTTLAMNAVYPGVDLTLRLRDGQLEKIFDLEAGVSPDAIRLRMNGAQGLSIDDQGRLQAQTGLGPVALSAPVAWQDSVESRTDVPVAWRLNDDGTYGFDVPSFDPGLGLTIDPLIQTTYLGGSAGDQGFAVQHPGNGDIYLIGSTESTDFPGTTGGAQPVSNITGESPLINGDVFVARLSADLTMLKQATFLGGSDEEFNPEFAFAANGDLILAGTTASPDFPGTAGGAQPMFAPGFQSRDGYLARISEDLTTLLQATYLGGTGDETIENLALDARGDVYVAGVTGSTDFPGTAGGAQPESAGPAFLPSEVFVAYLSGDLTTLNQSTYFGGSLPEFMDSLLVGPELVYIAGSTPSDDLPVTTGAAQSEFGGGGLDAFVASLSLDLTDIFEATYFGGSGFESATQLQNLAGTLYLSGNTQSTDLPGATGGAQATYGGGAPEDQVFDTYVAILDAGLNSVVQSTYVGGSGVDAGRPWRDGTGDVYVAGGTSSDDFPAVAGGIQETYAGGTDLGDAFVTRLNPALTSMMQSTYLGGGGDDFGIVQFAPGGGLYLAGATNSADFPGVDGGIQDTFGGTGPEGTGDLFAALLSDDLTTLEQATYFGGNQGDTGGLFVAQNGTQVYLSGDTFSNNLQGTDGGAQEMIGGTDSDDMFVALLDADLTGDGGPTGTPGPIFGAALPGARVSNNLDPVTFFGAIINSGDGTATDCSIMPITTLPADFLYQTTTADNLLSGTPNTPADVGPGGVQNFLFQFTPTQTFASTLVEMNYNCSNTAMAAVTPGVNTVTVLSTDTPTPDVIAITLTATLDGIAHIPGATGSVAVAMATVNVGAPGEVTVTADTGGVDLGVTTFMCRTDPVTGQCMGNLESELTLDMAQNETMTFTFVVGGSVVIPLDPANNRMTIRFFVGGSEGTEVGNSSFALWTNPVE